MVDIEILKHEIVERLKPLDPDKIILFGSYAYGTPNEDSDIDLFLVKDDMNDGRKYTLEARKHLRDIIMKYDTGGIDIISATGNFLQNRNDYFYKVDILKKGKVLYAK